MRPSHRFVFISRRNSLNSEATNAPSRRVQMQESRAGLRHPRLAKTHRQKIQTRHTMPHKGTIWNGLLVYTMNYVNGRLYSWHYEAQHLESGASWMKSWYPDFMHQKFFFLAFIPHKVGSTFLSTKEFHRNGLSSFILLFLYGKLINQKKKKIIWCIGVLALLRIPLPW